MKDEELVAYTKKLYEEAVKQEAKLKTSCDSIVPPDESEMSSIQSRSPDQVKSWRELGVKNLSRTACVIMAAGQGTRLGIPANHSKGMFVMESVGKSIFEVLFDRLKSLSGKGDGQAETLPLVLVMTSPTNHGPVEEFLNKNSFFGYPNESVVLFQQTELPTLRFEEPHDPALSASGEMIKNPDGNGSVFRCLPFPVLFKHRILYLHIIGIDNVLCLPCDPVFLGAAIERKAVVASKYVCKRNDREKVGVFAQAGRVVEYVDVAKLLATTDGSRPSLNWGSFSAANICNHFVFLPAILPMVRSSKLPYHIAVKDMKLSETLLTKVVKLELFIFDVFPVLTGNKPKCNLLFEVNRADEFAPLKNATGEDSIETANQALKRVTK